MSIGIPPGKIRQPPAVRGKSKRCLAPMAKVDLLIALIPNEEVLAERAPASTAR